MRNIPTDVLLSWPTPNYDNPITRGSALVVVNAVFISLVTTFVCLRLYTRIYLKRWFGTDDCFIVLAYIFTVGLTIIVILANQRYYWNRHVWDVPFPGFASSEKIAMAAKVLFTCASTFTRLSLICFYYRIIGEARRSMFRWVLHASMAYIVAIFISMTVLSIWQCTPISAYWTFPASGQCLDEGTVTLVAGIINCTADLLVTVLPITTVMQLRLPLRQRVGVVILLSLGLIVTIAGVARTYFIYRALIGTYDQSWFAYPLWISAAIEIDLGLLCACAPALRTLITTYFPSLSSVSSRIKYIYSRGSRSKSRLSSKKSKSPGGTGSTTVMEQELGDVSREVLSKGSRARSETIESSGSEGRSRLPHDVNFGYNRSAASPGSSDIAIAVSDPEGDIEAAQAGLRGQISELSLLARFEDEEYSIGRGARIHVDEQWTSTKEYQVPRLNTPTGHMPRTVRHDRGDGSQTSWFNDRDSGGKEKSRSPGDVEMSDLKDQQRRAWTQCFESGLSTNEDLIAREGADPGMQVNQQRGSSGRPAHTQRSTISEDRKRKLKPSQKSSRQKRERRKEREAKRKAKRKKDEWGRPTSLIKDLREGRFLV